MLSLNLYPVFIAAAETGSMTAAAERLHLTRTAVSHSIRVLEEGLSTKLFLRSKAGLALTEDGRFLYEHTAPLVDGLRRTEEAFRRDREHLPALTMATAHSLLKYFLLGRFSGDASPVNFITGSFRGSVETVAAGHADVGATLLPLPGVERFDVVPLGLVEEVFAAQPEALVRWGVPADRDVWTYAQLAALPLVTLPKTSISFEVHSRQFDIFGAKLSPKFMVEQFDLAAELASRGVAVALCLRAQLPFHPTLIELKPVVPLQPRPLVFFCRKDCRDHRVRELLTRASIEPKSIREKF